MLQTTGYGQALPNFSSAGALDAIADALAVDVEVGDMDIATKSDGRLTHKIIARATDASGQLAKQPAVGGRFMRP